jgi:hypothetical protein
MLNRLQGVCFWLTASTGTAARVNYLSAEKAAAAYFESLAKKNASAS